MICPWTIYQVYGDRRILERHLPAMTRWVEWCRKHSTGLIRDKDRGGDYGDWLSIGADTPKELIGTAYFAYSTQPGGQGVPGAWASARRRPSTSSSSRTSRRLSTSVTWPPTAASRAIRSAATPWPCKFDLLPEELRPKAARYLEDDIKAKGGHLSTGFVGVSYLLPVLTGAGKIDAAYRLLDARHVSLVAVLGQARRHDDLGALGRLDAGTGFPGPRT